jgi:hypothetical protein
VKYEALFEDEEDIFGGTPKSKYWDIAAQTNEEVVAEEFDFLLQKMAAMEAMLSEHHSYDTLDTTVERFIYENQSKIEELKKNIYMDLAGKLVYRHSD